MNQVTYDVVELNREEADRLFKTDWWVDLPSETAAKRQLFCDRVILPDDVYLAGLKQLLKRDMDPREIHLVESLRAEALGLAVRPSGVEIAERVAGVVSRHTVGVVDERE